MAGGDPWKRRRSVRFCAGLDLIFPVVIMSVYMYRLMNERTPYGHGRTTNGFFTPREKQGVSVFLWGGAFIINIIQLILTYYLFSSVKLSARDAEVSIRTSKLWLIFSNGLFVLLLSEFIFFIFFDKGYYGSRKTVSTLLCAAELFFKPLGMYFVKDFIDDLKAVYSRSPPPAKVQFLTFINNARKPQQEAEIV